MCGIWAIVGKIVEYKELFNALQPRGPDSSKTYSDSLIRLGFHRLKINDITNAGDQPMELDGYWLICNGEIYNHKDLEREYGISPRSSSDCEVILHLFLKLLENEDYEEACYQLFNSLDAEFACLIYDSKNKKLIVGRDPYGVRPLFIGWSDESTLFSSELKGMNDAVTRAEQFTPGHFSIIDLNNFNSVTYKPYTHLPTSLTFHSLETILLNIQKLLRQAVYKRVRVSDVKVCALLSGGLDSSLVASLASECLKKDGSPYQLETFSIGLKGSSDLAFAKIVADHIGSQHTTIEVTEEEFLSSIEEVIRVIESYDTTTVRASVGNYLVSKFIKEHTSNKVVLNGDYSDEVCGGYLYLKNSPTPQEFDNECRRLVKDIHLFDSLRSDRSISNNGLEARTPFSDKAFVEYYLSIPVELRLSSGTIEKKLLRQAFEKTGLLPNEVLWRKKEAFSDGVSNPEKSWHKIISEFTNSQVSEKEFEERFERFPHNTPQLKESYLYRQIFERYYRHPEVIPYYWLPKYCGDIADPSARELNSLYNREN